ncbi:hypothetical protein FS749_013988 [Ceratobasidium sp. UAMH 11750]|nr:hypothetical protein FS749_013988 [Ceratobasidium sp. UAMH 11750]
MKRETLDEFVRGWGGAEECVNVLKSPRVGYLTQRFLDLVRAPYPQKIAQLEEVKLCESPGYQALLIKAFETGRYEEVEQYIVRALDLKELMEDVRYSVTGAVRFVITSSCIDVNPAEPSQFADVFKAHYVGTAAADLYWHLGQLQHEFVLKDGHYYAKFCSIVQSSGTGKSRALIELKDQGAIVVYLNLRSKQESGNPISTTVQRKSTTVDARPS